MIILRDKPRAVWGRAKPGKRITVAFAGESAEVVVVADRSWEFVLEAVPANANPHVMPVSSGRETQRLEDILVEDVWVIGGHSNMEFEIAKVDDCMIETALADLPAIRLLPMSQGKGFNSVKGFEHLHEWSEWLKRRFRTDPCCPDACATCILSRPNP